MKQLNIDEISALQIACNITLSTVRDLLIRYNKSDPNYNALCELSTNLQIAKIKLKA